MIFLLHYIYQPFLFPLSCGYNELLHCNKVENRIELTFIRRSVSFCQKSPNAWINQGTTLYIHPVLDQSRVCYHHCLAIMSQSASSYHLIRIWFWSLYSCSRDKHRNLFINKLQSCFLPFFLLVFTQLFHGAPHIFYMGKNCESNW